MTIRDKVKEESPDGIVLSIEDLRKFLGIGTPLHHTSALGEVSASINAPVVEVLLVGHDLRGDFPKMRAEGINFDPHLHYVGCIDTHVIVEDACTEFFPKALGRLMQYYGLADGRIIKPKNLPASKAKFVFFGGHNAGNDAIGTLQVAIAQALDRDIKSRCGGEAGLDDYLTDEVLSKPLINTKRNLVLLSYDSEGVESNRWDKKGRPIGPATTEHGFAWLDLGEIADVPPGPGGVNWHPYIRARHWLNWDYRNFANFKYVVGNPRGFWKKYGETQYYFDNEGPAPFHRMFQNIACAATDAKRKSAILKSADAKDNSTVVEVATLLEDMTLGPIAPVVQDVRGVPTGSDSSS